MSEARPNPADRRVGERIATHHHVVFSDSRALGPLRMGVAVDRSSGGLRIITPHPEPLGTTLQIELRASADSPSVLLLEGRVVHITPADKGQHAMGIRLVQPALRPGTPMPKREPRERAPSLAAMRPMARPATAHAGGVSAMPSDAAVIEEAVTFRRVEENGRSGSWIALLGILALLLILFLLIAEAMRDRDHLAAALDWLGGYRAEAKNDEPAKSPREIASRERGPSASGVSLDEMLLGNNEARPARGRAAALGTLAVMPAVGRPALLDDGESATMRGGIPVELNSAAPLSASGFASMLDYADRAAARGETGLARAVVRRALSRAGQVAPSWVSLATEYRDDLNNAEASRAFPLREEIGLDPAPKGASNPGDVQIDVDLSDHLMRVTRGGATVAEFPVGLGRDGATQSGEYHIGSKARNPAWYHGGRVVAAEDPRNPIGDQWMGLSQDGNRTGLGIHPTAHPSSIGDNQSLGCVRMRPEDAESLYRLVPLGAKVTIHP